MTELTRRRVIKGAAWSLPVILAATAVPLAAASVTAGTADLRFIGTNLTKKSLKFKVENQGTATARDVSVLILWEGGSLIIPLGDIEPGSHAPTEHDRQYDIPADARSVHLEAVTLDGSASAVITVTR